MEYVSRGAALENYKMNRGFLEAPIVNSVVNFDTQNSLWEPKQTTNEEFESQIGKPTFKP